MVLFEHSTWEGEADARQTHHTGETRLALLARNHDILSAVVASLQPLRRDAVLLIVANPVDVLTGFALERSGLPPAQVIGSGTMLDSVRLRGMLAEELHVGFCFCPPLVAGPRLTHLQVSPSSIQANVLGEHGDSQLVGLLPHAPSPTDRNSLPAKVVWSRASVGGMPVTSAASASAAAPSSPFALAPDTRAALAAGCARRADDIIAAKGATSYGIGAVVAALCASVLRDARDVAPVSVFRPELGCCLSLPCVLGRAGVVGSVPAALDADEERALERSAAELREAAAAFAGKS